MQPDRCVAANLPLSPHVFDDLARVGGGGVICRHPPKTARFMSSFGAPKAARQACT